MEHTPAQHPLPHRAAPWVARALVAVVFAVNVQCALQFAVRPAAYAPAYQVEGPGALVFVQTVGILFLMWNVAYLPVIANPSRHRACFAVIVAQQAIGLTGESLVRAQMDANLSMLSASVARFIAFDAAGLVLLAAAFLISRPHSPQSKGRS
jgi:hypothetical protein